MKHFHLLIPPFIQASTTYLNEVMVISALSPRGHIPQEAKVTGVSNIFSSSVEEYFTFNTVVTRFLDQLSKNYFSIIIIYPRPCVTQNIFWGKTEVLSTPSVNILIQLSCVSNTAIASPIVSIDTTPILSLIIS